MKKLLLVLFLLIAANCFGQNRNSVWCFGDSALIDFSDTSNIIVGSSGLDTRGSCASICDENGVLLFYTNTRASNGEHSTLVYDSSHSVMLNGDSIVGGGWYQELVIVPNPSNDSTYLLFSISVTDTFGLVYSVIDMRQNGGLGAVTVKNIQLQNFEQVDCINAIKHGNGRDWWLIFRKSEASTFGSNNNWYSYLITSSNVQILPVQSIGSQNRTNNGHICFSPLGDKMVFISLLGLIEIFDFNRCTGLLSNPLTVEVDPGIPPFPFTMSCAFSADQNKLYVTQSDDTTFLIQYDLNALDITSTKDTLWTINFPKYAGGGLKLAPDNKIYLSNWYYNGLQFPYPYQDSIYNIYNMNLSVINSPDSLGSACDFQPYSFYLGGKRTYVGLPNNPDYEMPALAGSPCDTITSIPHIQPTKAIAQLMLTYITSWQTLFVNAQNLKSKNCLLQLYDVSGKLIYTTTQKTVNGYFTFSVPLQTMAKGVYVVKLVGDVEVLGKRFVRE